MIKAVAIDDELPALKVVENFCARTEFIQLEKTFTKPAEALKYVNKFPVDLLFLDIHMPSLKGTDLYKTLKQRIPVIFTTAFSEYAVEGFNLSAVDYLLKPFTYERFVQAVLKAKELVEPGKNNITGKEQFITVRADYSLVKISLADILYVESLDDYVRFVLHNQKPVVTRMTMKNLSEKLPEQDFIRVHRSYIIALRHVEQVRNKIIYIAGQSIPIGNSYEDVFFRSFNI